MTTRRLRTGGFRPPASMRSSRPIIPHALHMPSHIFTRLGMWQDSIDSNVRSAAAAKTEGNGQEAGARHGLPGVRISAARSGRASEKGRGRKRLAPSIPRSSSAPTRSLRCPPDTHSSAAHGRKRWRCSRDPPNFRSRTRSPTTRAASRLLTLVILLPAAQESAQLSQLRDALAERKDSYWSNQVEVQRLSVDAWIASGARDARTRL